MKALRVGLMAMVAAVFFAGCKPATEADSADDVASGGCPDEDPFCDEGGGEKSGDGVSSGDEGGESASTSEPGSGNANPFLGSQQQKADMSMFDTVLTVAKSKDSAAQTGEAKTDKDKAKGGKGKTKAKDQQPAKVVLHPQGMQFGMSSEQIAKLYDRLFDQAYLELYKKTPIGPQTKALDHELSEKKAQLRRSTIEFGSLPTGLDNGPLKGEYSYNNNESMAKLDLGNGIVRHFFFFDDRLWKIYDEVTLKAGSPLGTGFESSIAFAKGKIGTDPKRIGPDYDHGINFEIAEWSDGATILRLLNREPSGIVAVVFIDENVQNKLPTLRRNRPSDPTAVDPSVRDIMKPAPPPPDEKARQKPGQKK